MLTPVLAELRERLPGDSGRLRRALAGPVRVVHLGSHWPGGAVCAVFARGGPSCPTVVLKVDSPPAPVDRLAEEWAFMRQAQTIPALAERMAQPLALWRSGPGQILVQTGLPGVSLTVALRRRGRLGPRSSAREHAWSWTGSPPCTPAQRDRLTPTSSPRGSGSAWTEP